MNATQITTIALILSLSTLSFGCSSAQPCPDESTPAAEPTPDAEPDSTEDPIDPIVTTFEASKRRTSPNGETSIVWLAEGQHAYIGEISLQPDATVPLHRHDSEEYLFIQEGGGVMTIEGEEYELSPGSVVAVPSNAEHGYQNGPETTVAIQVFASPEAAQRFLEWAETDTEPDPSQDASKDETP